MTEATKRRVENMLQTVRAISDGLIVLAITPDQVLWSVDHRLTIADLHGLLQENVKEICARIARERAEQVNGRPTR
jgi:hypothetical protein